MKKRVIGLLLAVCMTAGLLAGCGGNGNGSSGDTQQGSDNQGAESGDSNGGGASDDGQAADNSGSASGEKELKVQVGPNPETIDPALNSAVDGACVLLHAFECLTVVDENGELQPGSAESWEVSEDGLTWTFHIREGLKWSDGSDFTANDFVYTFKRICDPEVASPYSDTVLGMVKGFSEALEGNLDALAVSAPDDHTLVLEMANPCDYFGFIASHASMSPVQQATVEANGDQWAISPEAYVSNGPFYMTEWVEDSHITFSKNPNYWNADAVKLDKLTFVLMEDPNASYSAYQTGEILMAKDVPTEEIPSLQGQSDFHVDPLMGTYYISLNLDNEALQDANVRKALSLAIDRDYVANTLMQGTYSPASNFMGPGWLDADGTTLFMDNANGGKPYMDNSAVEANLEEAKALMAEAGYPDGQGFPAISYTTNDSGYHKVVAEYLQQAWAELGVSLEVNTVEWGSFTSMRRNGEYEIARNGWSADYNDPSNQLDLFYSSNGNNDGNVNSPEYDAAIELARSLADRDARFEALHQAEDILMDQMFCIPLAYYADFYLMSDKVQGAWHSSTGYWYFMYADIVE